MEKQYRLLNVGEIIARGDRFWNPDSNTWETTTNDGCSIDNTLPPYRRLIEPQQDLEKLAQDLLKSFLDSPRNDIDIEIEIKACDTPAKLAMAMLKQLRTRLNTVDQSANSILQRIKDLLP